MTPPFIKRLIRSFITPVKVEEFNEGHCFRVTGLDRRALCSHIARLPGVVFTRKPGIFQSRAEFAVGEHAFRIEADCWEDGDWIIPQDNLRHPKEIQALREHIERLVHGADRGAA